MAERGSLEFSGAFSAFARSIEHGRSPPFRLVWLSRTSPFSKRAYSSWQPRAGRLNEGSLTNIQNTNASEQTGGTLMTHVQGSRLDEIYPSNGVLIPRKITVVPVCSQTPAGNFFVNGPPVDRFSLQC